MKNCFFFNRDVVYKKNFVKADVTTLLQILFVFWKIHNHISPQFFSQSTVGSESEDHESLRRKKGDETLKFYMFKQKGKKTIVRVQELLPKT